MLPPVARSLEDEHPLELLELLPAGELLLTAGDWPPEIGEFPKMSSRQSPDGHDAPRRVQVPLPAAQNMQHSPFSSAVTASQSQQ
jgi:hypothetical protein